MATKIHFLNVGHGDCTIIEHPSGRRTMIDINNGDTFDADTLAELIEEFPNYRGAALATMLLGKPPKTVKESLSEAGYKVELTDPIKYYIANWGTAPIFRYIQSHPDMDHMRGLAALRESGIAIHNFWDTANTKTVTDFKAGDEQDWKEYQLLRASKSGPTVLQVSRGEKRPFFNMDETGVEGTGGDGLHVLAPTPELCQKANRLLKNPGKV